jgi:hypothetical protein
MPGPICIVTSTGKICETTSYEAVRGKKLSPQAAKKRRPRSFEGRVIALMHLAHVADAPFCIVFRDKPTRLKLK